MESPNLLSKTNLMSARDVMNFLEGHRVRLKSSRPGEVVLDIGCGPGDFTSKLLAHYLAMGTEVIGCDISKNMIEYASERHSSEHVTFRHMDIAGSELWVQWNKGCCDKIMSNYVLQCIQDHRLALKNMFSLLRDGGRLFMTFLLEQPLMTALVKVAFAKDFIQYTKGKEYFKLQDVDDEAKEQEYREILKDVGFKEVDVKVSKKSFWWANEDSLMEVLNAVDPYGKYIPEELKPKYRQLLKKATLEDDQVSIEPKSGCVIINYRVMEMFAQK